MHAIANDSYKTNVTWALRLGTFSGRFCKEYNIKNIITTMKEEYHGTMQLCYHAIMAPGWGEKGRNHR